MSQRNEVAHTLVNSIKKRIRLNLRARVTDDIVIKIERSMFTDHTGKSRIEDSSIGHIAAAVREQRWVWEGAVSGKHFVITVPVRQMFTQFNSLEDLTEWNSKDTTIILTPKKPSNRPERANA